MYENSLRFYPFWDRNDISQLNGLLNLIEYIFDQNPNASHWVEIGSLYGESSSIILGFNKVKILHCIDSWTFCPNYNAANIIFTDQNKSADFSPGKDIFYNRLKNYIESKRCVPIQSDSISASEFYQDNSIDVIYIDADHSYEAVKSDLQTWFPKIKSGGFICGHDFHVDGGAWPGVTKAVNEFVKEYNLNHPMLFQDSSFLLKKN